LPADKKTHEMSWGNLSPKSGSSTAKTRGVVFKVTSPQKKKVHLGKQGEREN